ncbi:hypothetical protein AncyloWKF20_11460 [Ancylobacter sp. WKF20]|uniref:hypothetical protein n=1 Tax=Ancylobacter sp. WKF20 TaxID=3039801 RepID=UPI0024341011|nr:hypothetical protein [Ancylobacter sp. WKF20]WGD28436.1 hypothetical protein AncyloWKF20_11460 [Ancylobacter sp. WKF20]
MEASEGIVPKRHNSARIRQGQDEAAQPPVTARRASLPQRGLREARRRHTQPKPADQWHPITGKSIAPGITSPYRSFRRTGAAPQQVAKIAGIGYVTALVRGQQFWHLRD